MDLIKYARSIDKALAKGNPPPKPLPINEVIFTPTVIMLPCEHINTIDPEENNTLTSIDFVSGAALKRWIDTVSIDDMTLFDIDIMYNDDNECKLRLRVATLIPDATLVSAETMYREAMERYRVQRIVALTEELERLRAE